MVSFDHSIQCTKLILLMDQSKALDHVLHEMLLYKLHWYGVRGHLHQWICAFLMGHTQQVVFYDVTSSIVHNGQC